MTQRMLLAMCLALAAAGPAAAELVNENLLVAVPDGYKIDFRDKNATMLINEMVPVAENVHDWTEMITVQIYFGLTDVAPERMKNDIEKRWFGACANAESHSVASDVENGYPVAVWRLTCPLNSTTGKSEMTWFKAIRGNDSFCVVQKAFKFEPSPEQVSEWSRYLRKVSVCDSRLADRPCPGAAIKQ
jgi:hypothetical protein